MGSSITWNVSAKGVSKAGAVALLMEFWTSKGFQEHESSYNRLVMRRNGFGTVRSWIESATIASADLAKAPTELTVHIQVRPDHTKYEVQFALGAAWSEVNKGGLEAITRIEIDEFIAFINDWTSHTKSQLEK
jgi:hypothetical protein